MESSLIDRHYVMLKPVQEEGNGFARLEEQGGRVSLLLRAQGLPSGQMVRALLVCGGRDGAALNLGLVAASRQGEGRLEGSISVPTTLARWDALVLATDWPEGRLLASGGISGMPACSNAALQEAVSHFLSVPQADSRPAPVEPPEDAASVVENKQHPPAQPPLFALTGLHWPHAFVHLKPYFDRLLPCSPFEAPGWRFVRIELQADAPAPWCLLGRQTAGSEVQQICWAVPGRQEQCPAELHGYRWIAGREGDGFWILLQSAESSPAQTAAAFAKTP